jgi:hypothetical protein
VKAHLTKRLKSIALLVIIALAAILSTYQFAPAKANNPDTLIYELNRATSINNWNVSQADWDYAITSTVTAYKNTDFIAQSIQVGVRTLLQADDEIAASQCAPAIIYWYSAYASKFGLPPNETAIKWALDNITVMNNGLPKSGSQSNGFLLYEGYLLYVYYWANHYHYDTAKWDLQKGYASFLKATYQGPNGYAGVLIVNGDNSSVTGGSRYYDEWGETARCFLFFYRMGIDSALNQTLASWNYWNSVDWNNGGAYGGYYQYRPTWNDFECEEPFFLQVALMLQEASNYTMPFSDRLKEDAQTRYLSSGWTSYAWMDAKSSTVDHTITHAYATNNQRRMQNTLGAWEALLLYWPNFTSSDKQVIKDMLMGNGSANYVYPAWKYLKSSSLYDANNGLYRQFNTESGSPIATSQAIALLTMLGSVPVTATLAVPISDWAYESCNCVFDYQLLKIDFATNQLTIGITSPGIVTFQYGTTPFNYSFPTAGVYTVTFTTDWNSILVSSFASLPQRCFFIGPDSDEFAPYCWTEQGFPLAFSIQLGVGTNDVLFYANSTLVFECTATVADNPMTFPIQFSTADLSIGNYSLTARINDAVIELGKCGVTYLGDLNGDFKVDYFDVSDFVDAFNNYYSSGAVDVLTDYDIDGEIDYFDIGLFVDAFIEFYS